MSPFRRMKVGRMVMGGLMPGDLHVNVPHGKNGSQREGANQARNFPQLQAHHDRVFLWFRVIIGPPRNGPKSTLLVKRLRGVICAANFEKCRSCLALTRLVEHLIEQSRANTASPELGPDGKVVNVHPPSGFPSHDVTSNRRRFRRWKL